jgi:N-acetyl-gamma-glutamyl-phosphate reductase
MSEPTRVAVVGATGYAGFELARILLRHPNLETPTFYLREAHGHVHCLSEIFPQLRGAGDAPCRTFSVDAIKKSGAAVAFLATPHEASLEIVPELLEAGIRVVDLSGAFRFSDGAEFSKWYSLPSPNAEALREAVYGLPELYADRLRDAKLIANPGCYPTSVILGLRPLIDSGWIDTAHGVVCDCKSGASGAGKEPKRETHFVEVNENFRAYGLFTHRHTPEVLTHTGLAASDVIFTTHLLPIERGILSTLYIWLEKPRTGAEIESRFREFYANRPLVRISPAGKIPDLQHVTRTNFCDIGFALDDSGKRLVVVSCLDNLGKGAAGQAVQNLNGMMGFTETAGLL